MFFNLTGGFSVIVVLVLCLTPLAHIPEAAKIHSLLFSSFKVMCFIFSSTISAVDAI